MSNEALITVWRQVLKTKPWVLFKHGTVVVIPKLEEGQTPEAQATEIMKSQGPVYPGTPHGDFNVIKPEIPGGLTIDGWVVAGHCPTMFNYVTKEEMNQEANDMVIGIMGRSKRHEDSQTQEVVHVEH